jgi:serine/threonine protein kinase
MLGGQDLAGKTIAHYLVIEKISRAGMSVLYKARDLNVGRLVALKFIPETLGTGSSGSSASASSASQAETLARLEREARAASNLNHPNICTIYTIERYEGYPFIVMELLEGQTVRDLIVSAAPGALPASLVIKVGMQVADALVIAHQNGIMHRDIKPANLILTKNGQTKVLDFGLAKRTQRSVAMKAYAGGEGAESSSSSIEDLPTLPLRYHEVTDPGRLVGTVGYMSPEQARGEPLDARTDIFSLGAVLYEMAIGKHAFPGATIAVVSNAILSVDPEAAD